MSFSTGWKIGCPGSRGAPRASPMLRPLWSDLDPGPDHLRGRHVEQIRVIRADVVADQCHDPVLVVVTHHVPAFADHLAGHRVPPPCLRLPGPGLVTILTGRLPERNERAGHGADSAVRAVCRRD